MKRQFPVTLQLTRIGKTGCEAKSATVISTDYYLSLSNYFSQIEKNPEKTSVKIRDISVSTAQ